MLKGTGQLLCNLAVCIKGSLVINATILYFSISSFIMSYVKQCRPWLNAEHCSISSVYSLCAKVPVQGFPAYKELKKLLYVLLRNTNVTL